MVRYRFGMLETSKVLEFIYGYDRFSKPPPNPLVQPALFSESITKLDLMTVWQIRV